MKLTAEQIQENWDYFIQHINTWVSSPRKEKLLEFYEQYKDRLILMPQLIRKNTITHFQEVILNTSIVL